MTTPNHRAVAEPGTQATTEPPNKPTPPASDGAWVVWQHGSDGVTVEAIYGDELSALRAINGGMFLRAAFVPFGQNIREALLVDPRTGRYQGCDKGGRVI